MIVRQGRVIFCKTGAHFSLEGGAVFSIGIGQFPDWPPSHIHIGVPGLIQIVGSFRFGDHLTRTQTERGK